MLNIVVIGHVGKFINSGSFNDSNDIQYATCQLYPLNHKGSSCKLWLKGDNLKHLDKLLPGSVVYVSGKPKANNDKLEIDVQLIYFIKE